MAGTREGGRLAARKNKERYGDDYYRNIGRQGGKKGHTGGFASDMVSFSDGLTGRERASSAGAKGGRKSRKTPKPVKRFSLKKINQPLN